MTATGRNDDPIDLVLRAGSVLDGTGRPAAVADVAIRRGRIVDVGPGLAATGARVVDASDLVVAPGFIDVHTHSDLVGFLGDGHEDLRLAGVRQGVTTEIAGNCGFSVFPTPDPARAPRVLRHLQTLFGESTRVFADFDRYAAAVEALGPSTNVASLVGHGTLRAGVVGFDDRPARDAELEEMRTLTRAALEQGVLGLSSGLLYPPGSYALTAELVLLAEATARSGRPYVSHVRNEMNAVEAAIDEAIDIGRRSGAAVQVSHLKAAGTANHGRLGGLLERLEQANRSGMDVSADIYPYTAGSTVLHALLPPWSTEGGIDATVERLADPAVRNRIRAEFADPPAGWQNFIAGGSWDDVTIASAPGSGDVEGVSIGALARKRDRDAVDVVADVLADGGGSVTVIVEMTDADDLAACLASHLTMVGSDGIPLPGKPHPRWAGSFARVLSSAERARTGVSLEEAVRSMTSFPARRFDLQDRGVVRSGAVADLVVFDPETVEDRATYADPLAPPLGIHHVVVDGTVVIDGGDDTGERPGSVLRAGRSAA